MACFLEAQPYYFRNYQVNEGISSNTITCITQDKKGFMWFGTRNGLNRFDGTTFKVFRSDIGNPQSIGSNSILSLFEDRRERLWVGTYKGVYLYNAARESFSLFTAIPPGEVRYIGGDLKNNLWLVANYVLYRYNTMTSHLQVYSFPNTQTVAVSIAESGDVWCATSGGLVKKYDPAVDAFVNYSIASLFKGRDTTFIQTMYPISDSTLLIATLNQSLLFNVKSGRFDNIFRGKSWADNIQVHKIIRQSSGLYWFGTENGLYIHDFNTGASEQIQKEYANPYSIDDNVITDFCKDKEGATWVGTFFGGINYYSKQLNRFRKYFPLPGRNSISGNLVHEICSDKKGNLWIGTEDAGLNKLDIKTGNIRHFMPGKGSGSISYQNVHGLLVSDDELWIGTYEHGLDVLDLKTEKVIRHYEKSDKPHSLSSNFIVSLYKTKEGQILVGTWAGLYQYDPNNDDFIPMPYFNRQAQAIHEDESGTLWVCSYGNGVYYFNMKTGLKGNFKYDPKNDNSLSNNYVNNIFEDSRKNIWFCTESGLCRYDFKEGKIIRSTLDPALRDNQVFRVLEDDKGMLWISTSKGLIYLDPFKSKTKTYNTSNGLLSGQFNYNSAYKDGSGKMYFGTVKGMISFNPAAFTENTYVPPVYITDVQVNNGELRIDSANSRLRQSVIYTSSITLPYDSSTVGIEVSALSYAMPTRNEYMYKMEGLDKDWNHLKSNGKIYYTKLSSGNYVFNVKGSAGGEVWNDKITTLHIHVLAPWWASLWAYSLYVLAAFSIIFVVLRYYYIALREKSKRRIETLEIEKEREIYNAKIDFFTNITHEIRTPLTLIKLPVEKLLKGISTDSAVRENLAMIDKNTNRLIQLTDQLLDFRKAEANNYSLNFVKTDINDLLKELFATYKPVAEEKKLSFKLEMPRIALQAYVDPEAFRKILGNLFSNAIKYGRQLVAIKLLPFNSYDNVFHIEFKNDGYLIPPEAKEKIFEPFFRLKQTEKLAGTGIGLPLSRSLTELHKGKLELKQPIDDQNIFLLSIPVHQENEISLGEYETIENNIAIPSENVDTSTRNLQNISVLIAEDNKEIVNFLQKELGPQYNIYKAFDGQGALDILLKEHIHLVISDIMMPVMDGIELLKKMKTDLQFSHIPIILLTAKNSITSKIEGLEVGADAYIEKPFVMEYLMAQINSLLSNRNIIKEYYAHSPLAHIKGIASTSADKSFLERLHKAIDENITDRDLDVDALSKMMNMSRVTFYRKIKGLSDLTPNELINLSRLKKAAGLLAEGKYMINEVANIIGYNLTSNFSRDFHKQFGVTPSNYIKSLQKEK